jgi:hypothetical protein
MPYDEHLADRVRAILAGEPSLEERRMIGGSIGFMINGNFCVGVHDDRLTVRVPREEHEQLLTRPHVTEMSMAGKPMPGWLFVAFEGIRAKRNLERWVERGRAYALTLPPKQPRKRAARRAK